jgi:hypothetical protein
MYRNKAVRRIKNFEDMQADLDAKLKRDVQEEFAAYFKFMLQNSPKKHR